MNIVLLNRFYGYCPGLKRSLSIADNLCALAIKEKRKIYFDVPLAHNEIVKTNLEKKGLTQIRLDSETRGEKNLFLVSAHGASPEKIAWLKKRGFIVKSATCPKVSRLQELAAANHKKGYVIIIFGDSNHPEIIGVNGCVNNRAIIIKSAIEAEKIKLTRPAMVLSQTTLPLKKFKELIAILKKNNPKVELTIKETICPTVEGRIIEACDYAKKTKPDLAVVVGSRLSNNTKILNGKLMEVLETIMIGDETEINRVDFIGKQKILVVAGTSTPPETVEKVAEKLKSF